MGSKRTRRRSARNATRRSDTIPKRRIATIAKSPWTILIGSIVAILGLAAAVLGPLPDLLKTRTDTTSLTIEPISDGGVTQYALPLDAPLEKMPFEVNPGCTAAQHEWLSRFGVKRPPSYLLSIRNKAQDGPMLSIKNVRVIEKRRVEPKQGILFNCPNAGSADRAVLDLRLDRDGPAQQVDRDSGKEQPFAFNLAPGEEGILDLRLLSDSYGYSGRVVADVVSGDHIQQVDVPLMNGSSRFDRPGMGKALNFYVEPSDQPGEFYCTEYDSAGKEKSFDRCTLPTARGLIQELWSGRAGK